MADILVAAEAGADRVELCSALELGGLTPSAGLVEAALAESPIPVVVMVRPRAGGFYYDRSEFSIMHRDACKFLAMGVEGIVFGALDRYGCIDAGRTRELVALASPRPAAFHRAFDFAKCRNAALDALTELGCRRVLTSGGASTAEAGVAELCSLIRRAGDRIEVMPGGGITARSIVSLVQTTHCRQVHIGVSAPSDDGSIGIERGLDLCDSRYLSGVSHRAVALDACEAALDALRGAGLH